MSEPPLQAPKGSLEVNIGIDVSKGSLDTCALPAGERRRFRNDTEGREEVLAWICALKPARVVLEPTGGYERPLVAALIAAKVPTICVNPKQARDFIRGLGKRAKTDRVDAEGLALFGERAQPELRALPDAEQQAVADLVTRRRQLVNMRSAEKNRLEQASGRVRESVQASIEALGALIAKIEGDIDETIARSDHWKGYEARLMQAKGVGPVVARTLLAHLPELGKITSKRAASLAGLAPFARDSGQVKGRRTIGGGRAEVRTVLILAARSAAQHDHNMRVFHERLIAKGKPPMQAITACARKLLVWLNAMLRADSNWQPPALAAPSA